MPAYGLAVDATNTKAVEKLYRLKGRGFNKPIHVIFPSIQTAALFARISPISKKLMKKFWPGPLTIVVPLRVNGQSWKLLSAGTGTIGLRMPDNITAQALVEVLKSPITTTSANVSGQPSCYSVVQVKKQFEKMKMRPDFYLDGGKLQKTKPSTVVSLIKGVKILRLGPINETQIKKALK